MKVDEVVGVACRDGFLDVAARGSVARGVVVDIVALTAVVGLHAGRDDIGYIGHACVRTIVESAEIPFLECVWSRDAREAVNDIHLRDAAAVVAQGEHLRGEAQTAVVAGYDAIGVDALVGDGQFVGGFVDDGNIAEGTAFYTLLHDIIFREGRGLERVGCRCPREAVAALAQSVDAESSHRERLNGVLRIIAPGQKAEHALVGGSGYVEAECRVEPVLHVGEVLVAQQFDNHGRDFGLADFVVFAVAHAAVGPRRVVEGADVAHYLTDYTLGEVACVQARAPVAEEASVVGRIDAEGADVCAVVLLAGVGMEGQSHVDRHFQSGAVGEHRRPSGQMVYPEGTALVVVGIVVGA